MSPDADTDRPDAGAPEPSPCRACRGTGTVVSNLGGTANTVPCPWCDGTTMYLPGHDAQAHWAAEAVGGA